MTWALEKSVVLCYCLTTFVFESYSTTRRGEEFIVIVGPCARILSAAQVERGREGR